MKSITLTNLATSGNVADVFAKHMLMTVLTHMRDIDIMLDNVERTFVNARN